MKKSFISLIVCAVVLATHIAGAAILVPSSSGQYLAKSTLAAAVASADAAGKSIIVTSAITVSSDLTIPSTIALEVPKPGVITVASGKTLTIGKLSKPGRWTMFAGSGLVSFSSGSTDAVYPEMFGGAPGIDSGAAINKAIVAAGGNMPVVLNGIYFSTVTINANVPLTHLVGVNNGFTYGTSASRSGIKFTAVLTDGVTTVNVTAQPYITIENLTINGNGLVTNGFKGGFLSTLIDSIFINCVGPGALFDTGQTTVVRRCGFAGNQDGVYTTGTGTMVWDSCTFRENSRYGANINGTASANVFQGDVFESNTSHGLVLAGNLVQTKVHGCYFEGNDMDAGADGYEAEVNVTGDLNSEGIVFDTTYFSSTGLTKAANVIAGRVLFRDCSLTGDTSTYPLTASDGALATLNNSFSNYLYPANVSYESPVRVNPSAAIVFPNAGGYVDVSARSIEPGAGNFAISVIVSPLLNATATSRLLIHSDTNGFILGLNGGAAGMGAIYSGKSGSTLHSTIWPVQNSIYSHIVYSRISGVAYVYVNGVLVESFADTNNYSGTLAMIGGNAGSETGAGGAYSKVAGFTLYGAGLTQSNVLALLKNAGDPYSAGVIASMLINFGFSKRATTAVVDTVADPDFSISGSGYWATLTQ